MSTLFDHRSERYRQNYVMIELRFDTLGTAAAPTPVPAAEPNTPGGGSPPSGTASATSPCSRPPDTAEAAGEVNKGRPNKGISDDRRRHAGGLRDMFSRQGMSSDQRALERQYDDHLNQAIRAALRGHHDDATLHSGAALTISRELYQSSGN